MLTKLLEKYLDADLFKELHLETLTPEERIAFIETFADVIQQRIILRTAKELTEEQKEHLTILFSNKNSDPKAFAEFLVQEIPTFPELMEEEIAAYKKELIHRAKA